MIYVTLDKNQNILQYSFRPFPMAVPMEEDEFKHKMGFVPYNPSVLTFEQQQQVCIQRLSYACNEAIVAGCDVTLADGTVEHFALEETDQINLNAAYSACQRGATEYPYHADKSLCRLYSAADIIAICDAATAHKLYHTTYCNHMMMWARRVETAGELSGIVYGAELPEDLAANVKSILENANEK